MVGLGVLTWQQTQVWHDSERLWRHALVVGQESIYAHDNLGTVLFERGELEAAIELVRGMLAARAGDEAKVIEGTAETVALPAPAGLEPPKRKPNRLMMEVDTAIGPQERKPRKRVPSPAST